MNNIDEITKVVYEQETFRLVIFLVSGKKRIINRVHPSSGYRLVCCENWRDLEKRRVDWGIW